MTESAYDRDAILEEVYRRTASGETLASICRTDGFPSRVSIYKWLEDDVDAGLQFARARKIGFDLIAEQCLHIADNTQQGERVEESKDGVKTVKEDMLGHRKLQIDTRLKLLAKWDAGRYGDRLNVGNPENEIFRTEMAGDTAEKLAAFMALAQQRKTDASADG